MLSSSPSNIVVSPAGIIHVLGYTPTEGEGGAPISVRIHFHPDYAEAIYVRLVVGHKAVATTVREIKDTPYGGWQLDAVAPPFDSKQSASTKVLISVQALNEDNAILDTATFGEFSYWAPGSSSAERHHRELLAPQPEPSRKPKLHINTTTSHSYRRRGASHLPTPSPTSPDRLHSLQASAKMDIQLHRRTKAESLMRPKHGKQSPSDIHSQTPILDLVTPLDSICAGWTPSEVNVGRRLVRFSKVQDGRRLIVSCEPVKAEDYRDSDSVISCIYREESDTCFVTSVDIIFLLERLTSNDFPVEEKNRIRRNLEGLRPTTVSKHKAGFEEFFQRIMEFPDPKPRNIEKDLKVFEWSLLDQALDKILSKYTIDASRTVECPESSVEPSPTSSSDDLDYQLSYPLVNSVKIEDSTYVDLAPPTTKFETIPAENLRFLASSDGSDSYCSPVDPTVPHSYPLPLYEPGSNSATSWSGPEYKHTDSLTGLDFGYDVIQGTVPVGGGGGVSVGGGPAINHYAELDYSAYDGLGFSSIPGDPMGLVDHPYL